LALGGDDARPLPWRHLAIAQITDIGQRGAARQGNNKKCQAESRGDGDGQQWLGRACHGILSFLFFGLKRVPEVNIFEQFFQRIIPLTSKLD
jgi:hypothetical protein